MSRIFAGRLNLGRRTYRAHRQFIVWSFMVEIPLRVSRRTVIYGLLAITVLSFSFAPTQAQTVDPLPSWNDTAPKKAIIAFVDKVTKEGSVDFVPPAERIAV